MIAQLLRIALRQRFVSVLLGAALIAAGIWSFTQLSIEAYPDISDTQVVVISVYPGHAAEEIEQQVSVPIERALNSVPNVIARRSRTIFGLSVVELTFEYGTNDYFARQVVLEKLRDAQLPDGVTPTLGPLSTPIGELYRYTLEGDGRDSRELREIQDWIIRPQLRTVRGVTEVNSIGGFVKQFHVAPYPDKLISFGLTLQDVIAALARNNLNVGAGYIEKSGEQHLVRLPGQVTDLDEIGNIILGSRSGIPIRVKDVADIPIGKELRNGAATQNGKRWLSARCIC